MERKAFDDGFIVGYAFDGYIQVLPPSLNPTPISTGITVPGSMSALETAYWNGFVIGTVSKGVIEVPTSREGWYVETIRTNAGLGYSSFAVKRKTANGRPSMIYNIFIDNGIIKTAIREYPDYNKKKWTTQFEIGEGLAVAIAFDGYWEYHSNKWRMITNEDPNLFWVDTNGNLYSQLWDDEATKTLLATDAIKVKAIRAWRNVNIPEVDQGLVVGYIKTDGVYYRNYAYQENGGVLWEPERLVYSGTVNNVNLFLTNDYRMGFAIEDSLNKIHLQITERAWVGMALGREKFYSKPSASIDFLKIQYRQIYGTEYFDVVPKVSTSLLYGSSYNRVLAIENIDDGTGDYGKQIKIMFEKSVFDTSIVDFSLIDVNGDPYGIEIVTEISPTEFIITIMDFNNSQGDLTLTFTSSTARNEAGYPFDSIVTDFTPINLIGTTPPEVEEVWNE